MACSGPWRFAVYGIDLHVYAVIMSSPSVMTVSTTSQTETVENKQKGEFHSLHQNIVQLISSDL